MHLGDLAQIWRYPVKALRGEALQRSAVFADGLENDRTAALVVTAPHHARAGKTYRGKESSRLHLTADPEVAASFAADAAVGVALDRERGRYFDLHPVSLILDTWIAEIETLMAARGAAAEPLDVRRWRPNLVVHAAPGVALREADLTHATLTIGTVVFEVVEPIRRCIVPTYDPDDGSARPELLSCIASERKNVTGVYLRVVQTGTLAAGDPVDLH